MLRSDGQEVEESLLLRRSRGRGREEEDALGKSLRPNALARSESEESEATKLGSSSVPHRSEAQVG